MKLAILALFLLTGCDSSISLFEQAKANPDKRLCFNIHTPENIIGRYCLEYVGVREIPGETK